MGAESCPDAAGSLYDTIQHPASSASECESACSAAVPSSSLYHHAPSGLCYCNVAEDNLPHPYPRLFGSSIGDVGAGFCQDATGSMYVGTKTSISSRPSSSVPTIPSSTPSTKPSQTTEPSQSSVPSSAPSTKPSQSAVPSPAPSTTPSRSLVPSGPSMSSVPSGSVTPTRRPSPPRSSLTSGLCYCLVAGDYLPRPTKVPTNQPARPTSIIETQKPTGKPPMSQLSRQASRLRNRRGALLCLF